MFLVFFLFFPPAVPPTTICATIAVGGGVEINNSTTQQINKFPPLDVATRASYCRCDVRPPDCERYAADRARAAHGQSPRPDCRRHRHWQDHVAARPRRTVQPH